ncbi:MAG TPA: hypothetical protein VGO11_20280 [Chthoniobacteraceae bacterium]|jgi:hypothetical protein|nr:hypothetical protein [Chthoniobacteraceae bacterium]
MSTAATRPNPVAAWALAVLALLLLYLLSAPAVRYTFYTPLPHISARTFDPRRADGRAMLAASYSEPYDWLDYRTPLHPILERYAQWWFDRLVGGGGNP